ncbi:ABC transporter ATP-binding protein [Microcella daejeonensis]|uniref:ABC transporter ATP-binding protein n=1 Tax=Microcella daejeonensis TaxID=2994971 RepID=UPI00226FB1DA|nr:ABC transporter ATP-binding protein [Microcella daejeonensis]WAB82938.1 ABC transporter ATP-binding protein [Microcella daejeonensis]
MTPTMDAAAGPAATPALSAHALHRTFGSGPTAVPALRGVDLSVAPGELLVVGGASGSGKTTLLTILGGLDRPTSGTVLLGDRDLTALGEEEVVALRGERIGYVFQSFGLIPMLSAAENVEIPLRLRRLPGEERDRRVAAALDAVGLGEHARQRPDELSGGQQQRVGIARALVAEPSVLLADEPTGQLDSATGSRIMDLLVALARDRGVATVITTHDPELMRRADRVVHLADGAISSEPVARG